jgi:hypothetical protein
VVYSPQMVRQRPRLKGKLRHVRISLYLTDKESNELNEAADREKQSLSLFCADPIKSKVKKVLKGKRG